MSKDRATLIHDVDLAEQYRAEGEYLKITRLYTAWLDTLRAEIVKTSESKLSLETAEYFGELAFFMIGLLGLARIKLVADTTAYKHHLLSQEKLEESLRAVKSLFGALVAFTEIPWTIHAAPIHWQGELAQDVINATSALSNIDDALTIFEQTVVGLEEQLAKLESANAHNPDPAEIIQNGGSNEPYVARQRYVGTLSALGVLYLRGGAITHKVSDIVRSLQLVREAHIHAKNPDRLEYVAKKTIQASLDPRTNGGIGIRSRGLFLGLRSMMMR